MEVKRPFAFLFVLAVISGMALDFGISVFAKDKIHGLFVSMQGKRHGISGIFIADIPGVALPFCMYGTIPLAVSFS